nr:retrovirus-related Pol polyprotein from transposon TNT 1-94 [Tanacetum cinerariifolium]
MVVAAAMKMVRRLRWWGGGGNGVKAVVVVARDGEWHGGSNRSGDRESFRVRRKKPAGKVFRRRRVVAGSGGRRWWPVVGERDGNLDEFCGMKGIKRKYSNARTLQQNGVAERKNRTLIEAARTMLADALLPITFYAEAVNTACYVLNRDLVTKSHNKTPYELLNGREPRLDFVRPFGCLGTISNTLDLLGKFEGNVDEGFLVGYCVTSKAFRTSFKHSSHTHWSTCIVMSSITLDGYVSTRIASEVIK